MWLASDQSRDLQRVVSTNGRARARRLSLIDASYRPVWRTDVELACFLDTCVCSSVAREREGGYAMFSTVVNRDRGTLPLVDRDPLVLRKLSRYPAATNALQAKLLCSSLAASSMMLLERARLSTFCECRTGKGRNGGCIVDWYS